MRRFSKVLFLLLSVSLSLNAQQQQIDWNSPVPIDPNVKIGKLDNGLTYYIRKNTEPKQRAEFYIAQNVGAILEEDNQNGLAHFLEHMAFNGTKNFPGKGIIEYFESIGVKFGQNINAGTSLDETVYNLSDVPTVREGVIDTALLVLHDWSGFLSLEDKEIDSERGVIREEWRTRRGPDMRMRLITNPIVFKDSKYAKRDVIGDLDVINNFEHQTIKDYYHQWYRPDLQSIVIVGDIDVDKIEQKIKQLFVDIPKRENPTPRPYFEVPDNVDPLIAIASDPEAQNLSISIYIKRPGATKESRDLGYLKEDLIRSLISSMLKARMNEIVQKPNPPFISASVGIGSIVRTKEVFMLRCAAKNGMAIDGFKGILREAQRVKQFGFTATELERIKSDFISNLENDLKEKDKQKNSKYVNDYVYNFLEAAPISGIEFDYLFSTRVLPLITIDEVNTYAANLITDQNMVVSVTGPEKEGNVMPTTDEISKAIQEVKVEKIDAYVDNVSNKPLVEKVPSSGKVKKVKEDKVFGTTEWTLSNGVKIIFKITDFKADEIQLNAFSKGGISLADISIVPSASVASQFVMNGGVAEFSNIDLNKMLTGKVVKVQPVIGESFEGFDGSSSPKDFETMLQLVYLYFTQPRVDEESYSILMDRFKAYYANSSTDPKVAFRDSISVLMANRNPRVMPFNVQYLEKVSYKQCLDFYKDRFADASDFTFVFTGNINPDEVKGLIESYLGGLPNKKRIEEAKDNGIRTPKGKVQNYFDKTIKTPKSSIYIALTGMVDYNLENIVMVEVIKSVLRNRYTEEIREKEGATYGVDVRSRVAYFPIPSFTETISFDTDPKLKDRMIGIVHAEIKNLISQGPSEENLVKAKEYLVKTYEQNQRENGYWSSAIRAKCEKGIDINSKYLEVVNAIDVEKVKAAAEKLFSQGNVVEVVMSPKE